MKEASEEESVDWLDENADEHNELLIEPLKNLAFHLTSELAGLKEARGYKFPRRGFGRLRRPMHKIQPGQPAYRGWVHIHASRPSKSRFDDNPGLYFYLSHDRVFAGGGIYEPSSRQIKQLRMWIADDPSELDDLFKDRRFKKVFPNGFETDKAVKTFPRLYPHDHERIAWLKLQAYYIKRSFSKKELYSSEFPELVTEVWRETLRFNEIIYDALNTDIWQPLQTQPMEEIENEEEPISRQDLWDDRL